MPCLEMIAPISSAILTTLLSVILTAPADLSTVFATMSALKASLPSLQT